MEEVSCTKHRRNRVDVHLSSSTWQPQSVTHSCFKKMKPIFIVKFIDMKVLLIEELENKILLISVCPSEVLCLPECIEDVL